jgi:hypothetical protein
MCRELHRRLLGACTFALAAGCAGSDPAFPVAHSTVEAPSFVRRAGSTTADVCGPFAPSFDALVACRRANGTLESFDDPQINWRVRYFVRYQQMPCNEAPTVDEAYVFHTVTDDLDDDPDLTGAQRVDIRSAMYRGTPNCS